MDSPCGRIPFIFVAFIDFIQVVTHVKDRVTRPPTHTRVEECSRRSMHVRSKTRRLSCCDGFEGAVMDGQYACGLSGVVQNQKQAEEVAIESVSRRTQLDTTSKTKDLAHSAPKNSLNGAFL